MYICYKLELKDGTEESDQEYFADPMTKQEIEDYFVYHYSEIADNWSFWEVDENCNPID